jgi:hypothetical protein
MTVAELLKMPVGGELRARGAGFMLIVKTVKKNWDLPDGTRVQQVVLTDTTGDILADVACQKTAYGADHINRAAKLRIISGKIQQAEKSLKLFVTEYAQDKCVGEPDEYGIDPDLLAFQQREIEGKCRYGIACSQLRAGKSIDMVLGAENRTKINELVNFIKEGK